MSDVTLPDPGVDPAVDELLERWQKTVHQVGVQICSLCQYVRDTDFLNADYLAASPVLGTGEWKHGWLSDPDNSPMCEADAELRAITKLFNDALHTVPTKEML